MLPVYIRKQSEFFKHMVDCFVLKVNKSSFVKTEVSEFEVALGVDKDSRIVVSD
jgi:hypothetical protein